MKKLLILISLALLYFTFLSVRSLVQYNHGFAVMSTNSKANPGFPGGSVVGFAPDDEGRPVFIFSGMSTHTQDLLVDPRCSVTIASKEFKGAADGRVNLMGKVTLVPGEERDAMKAVYLAKHPGAFCKFIHIAFRLFHMISSYWLTKNHGNCTFI